MKKGFYARIALSNMKKNRRFYIPRILCESGLLGCLYIMMTLAGDRKLGEGFGGYCLSMFMSFGLVVHSILTVILLFYTNSFLMKQRKQEFGLYNILGMEKKHVGRVLFWESLFSTVCSIVLGLCFGTLFYKLCSLLVSTLLNAERVRGIYYLSVSTLVRPAAAFLAVDACICLINRLSIAMMKPVDLLQSRFAGEKEPKVKRLLLIIGLITLGAGYYIAVTTENPIEALKLFFLAVLLVMTATYFLFTAGSIFILKCLKRNKNYYYQFSHMPAVSGLLYRMKQNAVGLASVTVLATGVLIMISTTVSLYAGMEQTLKNSFQQHYKMSQNYYPDDDSSGDCIEIPVDVLEGIVQKAAARQGLEIRSTEERHYLEAAYYLDGDTLTDRYRPGLTQSLEGVVMAAFLTEEQYTGLTGEKLDLAEDEIAFCSMNGKDKTQRKSLRLLDREFGIKKELDAFPVANDMNYNMVRQIGIVLADQSILDQVFESQKQAYGENASSYTNTVGVTFTDPEQTYDKGKALDEEVWKEVNAYVKDQGYEEGGWTADSIWDARESLYGMYGTFLFLGILLGFVFIFATAMIIYYKQISEGYEDRQRFQIMKKIGMSEEEVRKTINKQIMLVFYLPLMVAAVHLAFAFPLLEKLLHVLLLNNTGLFVLCTLMVFVLFAGVYVLIYKVTARTYYKIVR